MSQHSFSSIWITLPRIFQNVIICSDVFPRQISRDFHWMKLISVYPAKIKKMHVQLLRNVFVILLLCYEIGFTFNQSPIMSCLKGSIIFRRPLLRSQGTTWTTLDLSLTLLANLPDHQIPVRIIIIAKKFPFFTETNAC